LGADHLRVPCGSSMDETQLRPGVGRDPIGHNGRKSAIERPKVRFAKNRRLLGVAQTSAGG